MGSFPESSIDPSFSKLSVSIHHFNERTEPLPRKNKAIRALCTPSQNVY